MKKTLFILSTMLSSVGVVAQENALRFYSSDVERAIHHHLGLDSEASVVQAQTDTITVLDLSGLALDDLRDLLLVPHVKRLNLRYNQLTSVGCLYMLPELEELDLSFNQLDNIDMLMFTEAERMKIDLTMNRISDLSMFYNTTNCCFTIDGIGLQRNEIDYEVNKFYTNVNSEGLAEIELSVSSSSPVTAHLQMEGFANEIPTDGSDNSWVIEEMPSSILPIIISSEIKSDTTYFVPPSSRLAAPGETRTIQLALPEGYEIYSIYATDGGEVKAEGLSFTYTAPEEMSEGTRIEISFRHNGELRGYTFISPLEGLPGDVDVDGDVDDDDIYALLEYLMGKFPKLARYQALEVSIMAADLTGDGLIDVADITALVNILHPAAEE